MNRPMTRILDRRHDAATLDQALRRMFRAVEVRAVPEHLKLVVDQLECDRPERRKRSA